MSSLTNMEALEIWSIGMFLTTMCENKALQAEKLDDWFFDKALELAKLAIKKEFVDKAIKEALA